MRDIDISLRQACLVGAGVIGLGMAARIIYRWKLANDNGFNYRDEVAFVKSCRNNALANAGIGHHTDPFNEFSYESTEFEWDLSNWIKTSAKVEQDPENIKAYILREYTALVKTSDEINVKEIIKNYYIDNRRDFENGLSNETIFKHFVFYVYREYPREKFRMLEGMQDYTGREVKEDSCLDEPEAEKVDIEGSKRRTELNQLYTQLIASIQKSEPVFNVFEKLTREIKPLEKYKERAEKLIGIVNSVKEDLEELEQMIGSAGEEDAENLKAYMLNNTNQFNKQMLLCLKEIDKANKILEKAKQQNTRKEVKPNNQNKGGNVNDLVKNLKPIEFDPSKGSAAAQALEGEINYVPEERSEEAEELMEEFQDIVDETESEFSDDEATILEFIEDNGLEDGNVRGYVYLNRLLESQDVACATDLNVGLPKDRKIKENFFVFDEMNRFCELSPEGVDYKSIAMAYINLAFTKKDKNFTGEKNRYKSECRKNGTEIDESVIAEIKKDCIAKETPLHAIDIALGIANAINNDIEGVFIKEVKTGHRTIISECSDEIKALNAGFMYYTGPDTFTKCLNNVIKELQETKNKLINEPSLENKFLTIGEDGKQILNDKFRKWILDCIDTLLPHRMLTSFIVARCVNVPDKEAKKDHEKVWGTVKREVHEITVKED